MGEAVKEHGGSVASKVLPWIVVALMVLGHYTDIISGSAKTDTHLADAVANNTQAIAAQQVTISNLSSMKVDIAAIKQHQQDEDSYMKMIAQAVGVPQARLQTTTQPAKP